MAIAVFIVISGLLWGSVYLVKQAVTDEENTVAMRTELRKLAREFEHASNYMTDEARNFVITGNAGHVVNYWNEVNFRKNMDRVIRRVKELNCPQKEVELLIASKNNSDTLVYTELVAMRLIFESKNIPENKMHPNIAVFKLPKEYALLSETSKAQKAKELMYDVKYQETKEKIMKPLYEFQQRMFYRMGWKVDNAKALTERNIKWLCIIAVIVPLMMAVLLIIFYAQAANYKQKIIRNSY